MLDLTIVEKFIKCIKDIGFGSSVRYVSIQIWFYFSLSHNIRGNMREENERSKFKDIHAPMLISDILFLYAKQSRD